MNELTSLSATEIATCIARRDVSPVEVMEAHLRQIERLNPRFNAFICVGSDAALEAARAAERRVMHGGKLPHMLGVPISIKSCIETICCTAPRGTSHDIERRGWWAVCVWLR